MNTETTWPLKDKEYSLLEAAKAVLAHVEDESLPRMPDSQCTLCFTYRKMLREAIEREETAVQRMTQRFLSWRLPDDFKPDCGIQFDAESARKIDPRNQRFEPTGTNLFDAKQTEAMVRHMITP